MRRITLLLSALLVLSLLGSDSSRGYDDTVETADIRGRWFAVSVEFEGKTISTSEESERGKPSLTFQSGKFKWITTYEVHSGTYTATATNKPARLNITYQGGRELFMIYRLEGDTLWIACNARNELAVPRNFHGDGISLMKYRRAP